VEEYGGYSLEDDAYEEVFNSMSPDEDGRVEFQNFRKIVGASIFTKDILNRGINHVVKSLEVDLFDGLKSGTEIEYYLQRPAPALKSEVNYIINPETGLPVRNGMFTEYYDDGISKRVEVNYVLNLKEGFEILYWPPSVGSNRIRSEVEFLNGRETDVRREFFEDGSFKTVYEPFSSLLDYDIAFRYTAYFKPPTLNTDPDQFIRERYTLERNRFKQGPEILFYSPGVKRHEGSFIRGQKIGLWTYYLPDGVTIDFTETWIIDTTSRVLKTIRV
jgi:antitoxin component YwqK of YwqJK toxin-antitoxin module